VRLSLVSIGAAVGVAAILAPHARAQHWVNYVDATSTRLSAPSALTDPDEKDYAYGDFDKDGDLDLVCVRKQPWITTGHRSNMLLMNENGVLVDRTSLYGTHTSVAGSQGMLDLTNDRDVCVVDVNGDTWPDLVTATTLTHGQPDYIRRPRIYINRGSSGGNWLGFTFDDHTRILDNVAQNGNSSWNGEHRFCTVSAGDIDGDGDQDLYFGDYEDGPSRSVDVNDRLLINNGLGYFVDDSVARMTAAMLQSEFAMASAIIDMNQDGLLDIIKDTALVAPQRVQISYNNPAAVGTFNILQQAYGNTPYHFSVGDLNNDNLPDLIFSDDGADRYKFMTGVSGGQATFSPDFAFSYTAPDGDDGFAGNNYIVDLDNDGFRDVVICDVDVQISGCDRRTRIYRNLGNVPNVTLQDQIVGGASASIPLADLRGVHDIAIFDINGDGWKDMVIGRCTGTKVWMCVPPPTLTLTYPGGVPTTVAVGAAQTLDVTVAGTGSFVPQAGTGKLFASVNGGSFVMSSMTDIGPGQYRATLPVLNCLDNVRFYVRVDDQFGTANFGPTAAPTTTHLAYGAAGMSTLYADGFEGSVLGWTVTNTTLTAGAWQVAAPIATFASGIPSAPGEDGEPGTTTTKCWVTQNGVAGGAASASDVDGGPTDLVSPVLDFAGTDGLISYRRWFFCSNFNDNLTVSVSNNGGSTWTTVETVTHATAAPTNQWTSRQFRVGAYVTPTANVRVRFRTSDNPNDSTTEAAFDAFKAEAFSCAPCQQVIPLATNGNATMSVCGGNPAVPGAFLTVKVASLPSLAIAYVVYDLPLIPTPWQGGTLVSPAPILFGEIMADASGTWALPAPLGGLVPPGIALHTQTVYLQIGLPNNIGQTNVVKVQW